MEDLEIPETRVDCTHNGRPIVGTRDKYVTWVCASQSRSYTSNTGKDNRTYPVLAPPRWPYGIAPHDDSGAESQKFLRYGGDGVVVLLVT